jgi:hypothetical protein
LDLAFSEKSLREICERQLKAERVLGIATAKILRSRLADLRDAECMDDIVAGPPAILNNRPPGRIAIPIGKNSFLFLRSNHRSTPITPDGNVRWSEIYRIQILRIGDKND